MLIQLDQFDRRDIRGLSPRIVVDNRGKEDAGEDDNTPIHGLNIGISHGRKEYHDESKNQEHHRKNVDEETPSAQREVLAARRLYSADSQPRNRTN